MARKKSICGVALHLRRCSVPASTLPSSGFERLAYGAFYFAIPILTFCEIINIRRQRFLLALPFFPNQRGFLLTRVSIWDMDGKLQFFGEMP
jgi:hypothetical protein